MAARELLLADYPQWQSWRRCAHELKAQVVRRLDDYLAELTRGVRAWGGQVYEARDAAQARDVILTVARRHGVRTVVKSKSMTTEELALNPHLERAGLKVTETDLGEFLVQLAGEPPSHLTAPALHLDRHRIADLLREHLGISCQPDPAALTRQASAFLRPCYQQAHLGVTGVNFAAVREATLVMLENEGNLQQTAALPPVQVAVMGLEKMAPALADLEVFLRLLPASATGQRLTALVHFLKGLKAGPAGTQAFYLVLLDNGRRRLAAEPQLRQALYCLRCGACLNICPVFQAGGAHLYGRTYPGAIGILLAPYVAPVGDIADFCTQCGACEEICPVGIPLPELIRRLRAASRRCRAGRLLSQGAGVVVAHPRLYRRLERPLRRLVRLAPHTLSRLPGFAPASRSFHQTLLEDPTATGGGEGGPGRFPDLGPMAGEGRSPVKTPARAAPSLSRRLEEASGTLHRLASLEELAELVVQRGREPLVAASPLASPLQEALSSRGLTVWTPETFPGAEADTVILSALGAVAEVGAVLIPHCGHSLTRLAARARRLILVAPAARSHLSLRQGLALTGGADASLVTWHTGPSRTADIEKVLILGAQGPAQVDVVLLHGPATRNEASDRC